MDHNFTNADFAHLTTKKLALCVFFLATLVTVPLFLLASVIQESDPHVALTMLPSLMVFKYWGRAFNEESMATYLSIGYGVIISGSTIVSLL